MKTSEKKRWGRRCEITKRHKQALEMRKSSTIWKVQSQANKSEFYVLYRSDPCDCKMSCTLCGACNHMYNCSCIDFALHDTVCKHIYLLHMHCKSTQTEERSTCGTNNQLVAYDSTIESAFIKRSSTLAVKISHYSCLKAENLPSVAPFSVAVAFGASKTTVHSS